MAQDISLLFSSLENARKSVEVNGLFTVNEPSLNEQKELLKSVFDPLEAPARLSIAYDEIIRTCVESKGENIDIIDRIYLLREIREMVMGDTFTRKSDNEDEKSESVSYTYQPVDYKSINEISRGKTIKVSDDVEIEISVPSIERDADVNKWLLNHIFSYRRNNATKITEQALTAHITAQYLTFEIIKYIKEIRVKGEAYLFQDMIQSEQMRAVSQLPQTVVNQIEEIFHTIKDCEKFAFSAKNNVTNEIVTVVPDFNLFTKEL